MAFKLHIIFWGMLAMQSM